MYIVALIQNQSEMAHYGYADARPLLNELGYKTVLYTADNIDDFLHDLSRKKFDAAIFASNALNDKTIRNTTNTESFCRVFEDSLADGLGLLCLHQLKLAQTTNSHLSFLPLPLNQIKPVVRPSDEKSAEGSIDFIRSSDNHITLLYPNRIVQRDAHDFMRFSFYFWSFGVASGTLVYKLTW